MVSTCWGGGPGFQPQNQKKKWLLSAAPRGLGAPWQACPRVPAGAPRRCWGGSTWRVRAWGLSPGEAAAEAGAHPAPGTRKGRRLSLSGHQGHRGHRRRSPEDPGPAAPRPGKKVLARRGPRPGTSEPPNREHMCFCSLQPAWSRALCYSCTKRTPAPGFLGVSRCAGPIFRLAQLA